MSKLMKTMIASVLAVAMTGPAAAALYVTVNYVGDNLRVQITPQGCKNFKSDKLPSRLGFNSNPGFKQSGNGFLEGYTALGTGVIDLLWVGKKVEKDLTLAISAEDVGNCIAGVCTGIAEAIQGWLAFEGCGLMTDIQSDLLTVTKGQVKLSKDGDTAKVDIKVEGEYLNDDLDAKKVKVRIKSTNMDFVPVVNGVD